MAPRIWSMIRNKKAPEGSQSNIITRLRASLRARRQPRALRTEIQSVESHQESTRSASDLPRGPEANGDLSTTSDIDLGIHRQETTPQQSPPSSARVRRPTDKTFRLRGIPKEWDKAEVQQRVKDRLGLGDDTAVVVRSLSKNPYRHEERVATIELPSNTITGLGQDAKSEQLIMIEGHELLLDTHFFGMTPLHAADDASCDVDIIALSGLNGHAFGSFKSKTNEPTYMWLRDSLPSDIPHARIFIYGYDTQIINSNSFQNIGDLGQQLKSDLILVRTTTKPSTNRKLILIGHSLGGIMIKSAINKMFSGAENYQEIAKSICGVLFFGVPNQGMDIRSLIPMVGDNPNRGLLQSLGMESEVLHNLSQSFQTNLDSPHSMVFSFYETKQSPTANRVDGKWTMSGPPTVLVDRQSATNGRHWEQDDSHLHPVNRTHSEMVKLDSRHDAVYIQALSCVKRLQEASKLKLKELSKIEQNCLKSLSFPEQTLRLDQIHTASNTCNWLLWHQSYQAWMNDPSGLLWIEGAPGVGKSVLMKHSLQHLGKIFPHHGCLFLSFFVHGQGSPLQRSKLGLLRTILHQILQQKPDLFSLVLPEYVQSCKTMESWQWYEGKLQIILEKCLETACRTTCAILLVDALDELGEDIALEVVEYFQYLINSPGNHSSNLRICFSCRHYPAISFNNGHRICVERENSDDIHHVVSSMLEGINDFHAILSLIVDHADGVFQWAVLVSDKARKLLRQNRMPAYIRQEIQALPKGLHELYSGLLIGASRNTLRLFQWLCFSKYTLNAAALRQALSVSIEQSCSSLHQYEEILGFKDSVAGVSSMVKTLSKGLAKVTPISSRAITNNSNMKVILIHQSVREFFMCGGFECMDKSLSVNPVGLSNAQLSEACLKLLATREAAEILSDEYPFGVCDNTFGEGFDMYAFYNWAFHAAQAEGLGVLPKFLLRYFDTSPNLSERQPDNVPKSQPNENHKIDARRLYRKGYKYDVPHTTTFVHLLSQNNLSLMIRYLIDHGHMLDMEDGDGRTPFFIAVIEGMSRVAKLLLESGQVNPDCQDRNGRTPLSYAAERGFLKDVEALLASPKVNPSHIDSTGRFPLMYALSFGRSHVANTLLESAQYNINHQDNFGRTPLSYAAEMGLWNAVKKLISLPNIDSNIASKDGWTPLHHAAKSGHVEVVRALITSSQVDPNRQDAAGMTPLSHAAIWGRCEVTSALLELPTISVDSKDGKGQTALSHAVMWENHEIVNVLLKAHDIKVNSKDVLGRTPLSYAAQKGSMKVFEALIEAPGVDVDSQDHIGRTPLSYAAQEGSLKAVEALIESSMVDVDSQDHTGRTPLSYASEKGHWRVVNTLLRHAKCDGRKEDKKGQTPHSYAIESENKEGCSSALQAFRYSDTLGQVRDLQRLRRETGLTIKRVPD